MTDRKKLKELGLDYHKIAEFLDMTPGAFQNSSARERYESAILRSVLYVQEGGKSKNGPNAEQPNTGDNLV
jgi:hypothetical protein